MISSLRLDSHVLIPFIAIKNIELSSAEAEFAITMRKFAQGKGFARFAICEIIRTAIEDMNLKFVYWDVLKANLHAVHFYDKIGGKRIKDEKCSFYLTKMNIPTEKKSEYICFYIFYIIALFNPFN